MLVKSGLSVFAAGTPSGAERTTNRHVEQRKKGNVIIIISVALNG